ncbi:MAG TPA: hypothetical protein VHA56_07190 [Mucilaginibacter sp.]|nr:hypothetical protein [Mucilaginibacter sp.]
MDSLFTVYVVLLLSITLVGFIRYKKLNDSFRILTILILCTLVSETIKKFYGRIYHNSMPLAHLWSVIEFALFSVVYYKFITADVIKKIIIILIPAMLILEIFNIRFFEQLSQFPSLILEASHIIYVVYALVLFRQMLFSPAEESLFKQSLFWFNINMLFYATTMFLNFALLSYFIENKLDVAPLVYISVVVNFIFYIVIGVSLLIDNKRPDTIKIANG